MPPFSSPVGRGLLMALFTLAVSTTAQASFMDWVLPKHDVQVITVTDTTPAGAPLRPASPEHPVYYMAVSLGYHDLGGIIAGDKLPKSQDMVRTIAKVLAKQGYLPATQKNPPSIMLLWAWGSLYTDRFGAEGVQTNQNQLLRFLGGYKLGLISKNPDPFGTDMLAPGLTIRTPDADRFYDLATDDLYIVAIAAYDFRTFAQSKKKVLLWTTKISCPSIGLAMDQTLPTMVAIAGPNIGRDTAKPVWVNASDKFKPEVKIGDPKLVEYLDHGQLPIVDASQHTPPKTKRPPTK
jgi:hypothetical protein